MAQKHKQLIFSEYNLGLNNGLKNYKSSGLAKQIYNVECKNGEIKSASMFENVFDLIEPAYAQAVANVYIKQLGACKWLAGYEFFRNSISVKYVVFCTENNQIYYYQLDSENPEFKRLSNIQFTSTPTFDFFIKEKQNVMLFCSATDNMWVWDGINEPYEVLDAPKVSSMAVSMDRLFVVSDSCPYSVLFSDDLDPSNWSMISGEAGEVVFSDNLGKVLKVFALDNYIYVVREFAIIKLYAYSKIDNTFNVSRVHMSTSKIYKNTATLAGNKIIFMCADGIYSFDGLNAKKIYNQLNPLIFNVDIACAKCIDNTYYLCVNLYEKLDYNNALVCIDLESESVTNICYGYNFQNLYNLSLGNLNKIVVFTSDLVSKNANMPFYICKNTYKNAENANFLYLSQNIMLQPEGINKTLCKLNFLCKTNVQIEVVTDYQTKKFSISKSDYFQTIKLNLKSNIFAIKIYGEGEVDISNISLEYSFME